MNNKKYLGELLTKEEVLKYNTLVISPCGSGKTTFIFNNMVNDSEKVLYLCDNSNLKRSVLKNKGTTTQCLKDYVWNVDNIEVMTYKKFGKEMAFTNINEFLKDYSYIVADEIHNLLSYYEFAKDSDLRGAIDILFNKQVIPIIMFTATPYHIEDKDTIINKFLDDISIINFMEHDEIQKYIDIRKAYISHISQIQCEFKCYKEIFEYRDGKALVFTPNISQMKMIEEMAIGEGLMPISIWSEHNDDNPLSKEQLRVRDKILLEGILDDNYDVLIINRALETGVDIVDERFRLFISCTSNPTQTYQSRSRLRMDLDTVILKSKYKTMPTQFSLKLEDKWLNTYIDATDMKELLKELNLKDGYVQPIGVSKLIDILKFNGYEIKNKSIRTEGKRKRVRVISKLCYE